MLTNDKVTVATVSEELEALEASYHGRKRYLKALLKVLQEEASGGQKRLPGLEETAPQSPPPPAPTTAAPAAPKDTATDGAPKPRRPASG